mmetsp:Transcript_85940/g.229303  ORF Transcript_85940/g.229303 Transcript_85940/m.229303 type:complete len:82 (+) Transcript_85940:168-413(+)
MPSTTFQRPATRTSSDDRLSPRSGSCKDLMPSSLPPPQPFMPSTDGNNNDSQTFALHRQYRTRYNFATGLEIQRDLEQQMF